MIFTERPTPRTVDFSVFVANTPSGQKLAQSLCIACHGPQGLSVSPIWPSLAGQKYSYLVKAMKEYRNGVRQDPLMTPQAQTLTEAQIDAVSWYYSSMRVQIVETPQGAEPREN